MAWRDRLKPASFRGVPFYVDGAQLEAGRRVVLHEYPLRDLPSAQDLGRAQRKINVTAYVLGKDYLDQRDRLVAALEQGGAGTLQLPTWPAQQMVLASPAQFHESKEEGGICRISLSFAEAGEPVHPATAADDPNASAGRTVAARSAARDSFAGRWRTRGPGGGRLSSLVTDALGEEWGGLLAGLAAVASDNGRIASGGGVILGSLLGDWTLGERQIIGDGDGLATGLLGIIAGLVDGVSGTGEADGLLRSLASLAYAPRWGAMGTGVAYPRGSAQPGWYANWPRSTDRQTLTGNRAALADLLGQAVLIEQARHLTDYLPVSTSDAIGRREGLIVSLDEQVDRVQVWDADFIQATDADKGVSGALIAALTAQTLAATAALNRAAGLATVQIVRLQAPLPAVVLAYDRREDEREAADIVARNRVVHPLALPAGEDLEIRG